jgi:hypothetical protein
MNRDELTTGQAAALRAWEDAGFPTTVKKLGYSCGSRGNGNYHSTWAIRNNEGFVEIIRITGDGRSTWRKMVKTYGPNNVG